ncbi:hypothetical protein UQ79_24090, partial [Shigella dysenteriae]
YFCRAGGNRPDGLNEPVTIAVYEDSKPGTLNDFLIAPDEGDLKPDVVKRFEEMVAQAQQSAGAAAGNAQQTAQDVAAAAGY